jgi:hypothetical protein
VLNTIGGQGGIGRQLVNGELLIGESRTSAVLRRLERRFCDNFVAINPARARAFARTATQCLSSPAAAANVA